MWLLSVFQGQIGIKRNPDSVRQVRKSDTNQEAIYIRGIPISCQSMENW